MIVTLSVSESISCLELHNQHPCTFYLLYVGGHFLHHESNDNEETTKDVLTKHAVTKAFVDANIV